MTTATPDTYITVREAARRAKVTTITIRRWLHAGLFGYRFINRREREINESDFDALLSHLHHPVSKSSP